MDITPRTLIRIFLLLGGIAIAVLGIADGPRWYIALGGLAALLGAFGLWYEYSRSTGTRVPE